jgi:hypothetical protein
MAGPIVYTVTTTRIGEAGWDADPIVYLDVFNDREAAAAEYNERMAEQVGDTGQLSEFPPDELRPHRCRIDADGVAVHIVMHVRRVF